MIRKSIAAAALLAATSPLAAALPADFKAQADAYVAASYPADGPGAVVLITEHGKPIYRAASGLADVTTKTPITKDTVFRYGSITKQFAAATLMKYVEAGKISLDDKLSKFLPDYPMPGADVTVRQLLNHTSGIASYTGLPGWMPTNAAKPFATLALVDEFKGAPLDFAPGSEWRYNNSGYILVGALIEKVSGKPWADAVADEIVKPLRLKSIRYGVDEAKVAGMARGYGFDGKTVVDAPPIHMSVPGAAGALVGNADDLARWAHAIHHGKVVNATSYAQMTAPTKLTDGATRPYGFGFELDDLQGRKQVGHSGGIFGFTTDSVYVPEADLFVTILSNSDSPRVAPAIAAKKIAAMALGTPFADFAPQPLDVAAATAVTGEYEGSDGKRMMTVEDGKAWWTKDGGRPSELIAAGKGRYFFGPNVLDWVEFRTGPGGEKLVDLHRRGAVTPLVYRWARPAVIAAAVTLTPAQLDALAGKYDSPAGPITVARDGETLMITVDRQDAMPMKPVSPTQFEIRQVGAKIAFTADGLVINHAGRDLPAKRVK